MFGKKDKKEEKEDIEDTETEESVEEDEEEMVIEEIKDEEAIEETDKEEDERREHEETTPVFRDKASADALLIEIEEEVNCQMDHSSKIKKLDKIGFLRVKNLGETDRIFDIDLQLDNVSDLTELEETLHIPELNPQKSWEKRYIIKETDESHIDVSLKEVVNVLHADSGTSTVLFYGDEMEVEYKLELEFKQELGFLKLRKNIPSHLIKPKVTSKSIGKPKIKDNYLIWELESPKKGLKAECKLLGKIDVNDVELKQTGDIEVVYSGAGEGKTKLIVIGADGYTRCKTYVESDEKEDQPEMWENRLIIENSSEFPIELHEVKVFDNEKSFIDVKYKENELIILSKDKWHSSIWEKKTSDIPLFSKTIKYTVKPEIIANISGKLNLSERSLAVAHGIGSKKYSILRFPSYVTTPVEIETKVVNSGSIAFKNLKIDDDLQPYFRSPDLDDITLWIQKDKSSGVEEIEKENYSISIESSDGLTKRRKLICEISIPIEPETSVVLKYNSEVVKPSADLRFDPKPKAIVKFEEKSPDFLFTIDDELYDVQVVHVRRKHTWYKEVLPKPAKGFYDIVLSFKNRSDSEITDIKLQDLIPEGFTLYEDDSNIKSKIVKSENGGTIREWVIENIGARQEIEINYVIQGKEKYSGKDIFVSF